jgi:hypothetical protein
MKAYVGVDVQIYIFLTSTMRRRENSWSYQDSNSDQSVVQPVASGCTYYAIPDGVGEGIYRSSYSWRRH